MSNIYLLDNTQLNHIFQLFFEDLPVRYEIKNTSHGEDDFREAIIAELKSGEKYVIKLSDNDFTFPDKIEAWKRCAEEYRKLGYYCPAILYSKNGDFPTLTYKDHNCVAYVEEYCKYTIADKRSDDNSNVTTRFDKKCMDAVLLMTAKIAAKRLDFTDYPSGWCLFDTFAPSDETDEVMDNALDWKKHTDTLPPKFQTQVQRIWRRWIENRNELEKIYHQLPTSVFQADLNPTNILLDESGNFIGVFDFNLCGKEVFLNYLFREIAWMTDEKNEINYILETLKNVSKVYSFNDAEKQAASLLYRCNRPLWYTEVEKLKDAGNDVNAIQACLDYTEEMQTQKFDFEYYMNFA